MPQRIDLRNGYVRRSYYFPAGARSTHGLRVWPAPRVALFALANAQIVDVTGHNEADYVGGDELTIERLTLSSARARQLADQAPFARLIRRLSGGLHADESFDRELLLVTQAPVDLVAAITNALPTALCCLIWQLCYWSSLGQDQLLVLAQVAAALGIVSVVTGADQIRRSYRPVGLFGNVGNVTRWLPFGWAVVPALTAILLAAAADDRPGPWRSGAGLAVFMAMSVISATFSLGWLATVSERGPSDDRLHKQSWMLQHPAAGVLLVLLPQAAGLSVLGLIGAMMVVGESFGLRGWSNILCAVPTAALSQLLLALTLRNRVTRVDGRFARSNLCLMLSSGLTPAIAGLLLAPEWSAASRPIQFGFLLYLLWLQMSVLASSGASRPLSIRLPSGLA